MPHIYALYAGDMKMAGDNVYDSRAVARYLVGKAGAGILDSLQVMKLVYIAHGFVLGSRRHPLLEDDVEAWQYGPAMRRVYDCLPGGRATVTSEFERYEEELDADGRSIVDYVYDKFGRVSGLTLSKLTHREGSPWKKTWDAYGKNAIIPQDLIAEHYQNLIQEAREAGRRGERYSPSAL